MTYFVGAIVSNFSNFMGAKKQFTHFLGAIIRNLPEVEIVGPAEGTTELMIRVGRLIVEVVGLTINFLVAVEAVESISLTAEVTINLPVLKNNNLESMFLCHSILKLS